MAANAKNINKVELKSHDDNKKYFGLIIIRSPDIIMAKKSPADIERPRAVKANEGPKKNKNNGVFKIIFLLNYELGGFKYELQHGLTRHETPRDVS